MLTAVDETCVIQPALKEATANAQVAKPASCYDAEFGVFNQQACSKADLRAKLDKDWPTET